MANLAGKDLVAITQSETMTLLLDTDFPLLMQFDLRFIDTERHTRLRFMTLSNDRPMISSVSFFQNIHHTDRRIYRVSRVNSRNYLLNYSSFEKAIIIRFVIQKEKFRMKVTLFGGRCFDCHKSHVDGRVFEISGNIFIQHSMQFLILYGKVFGSKNEQLKRYFNCNLVKLVP